jgi:hypothetical protein
MDPDPDPYWPPSGSSGSGSVKMNTDPKPWSKRHRIPDPGVKRHRIPDPQHCLKAADLADVGLELGVNGLDVLLEALAVRECALAEVAQLGARPLRQLHRLLPQVDHRVVF